MTGGAWPRLTWEQWQAVAALIDGGRPFNDSTIVEVRREIGRARTFRRLTPPTMKDGNQTVPNY